MRVLDTDNEIGMLENLARRCLRVHVLDAALVAAHPKADDVDEREHASLGSAKDLLTVVLEVAPAGAARIHDCCRPRGQRHVVGEESAAVPVLVAVNVHETRDHVEPLQVHAPFGGSGGDARGHARDPSIADGHIPNAVDLVGRIDDVTAGQKQVGTNPAGR